MQERASLTWQLHHNDLFHFMIFFGREVLMFMDFPTHIRFAFTNFLKLGYSISGAKFVKLGFALFSAIQHIYSNLVQKEYWAKTVRRLETMEDHLEESMLHHLLEGMLPKIVKFVKGNIVQQDRMVKSLSRF
jgi:hypothetical protein